MQSLLFFSLLVVEDELVTCNLIERMVAMHFPNCIIHTAENGVIGLQLYKELIPDIVITDVNLPEMNGIVMAREIRSINAHATYIVLTAHSDTNVLEQLNDIGFCALMRKPFDLKELFATIERCFAERAATTLS